jgi:SGNH hydrolase-like domain, acetyltransferase AlgX
MTVLSQSQPTTQECIAPRHTSMIGQKTALTMIVFFAALIAIPPIHQLITELHRTGRWRFLTLFETIPSHGSLKQFEESLARDSVLGTRARLLYRECLMRWLDQGNEKIVVGRDGFVFFLQEIEMAAGPGFLGRRSAGARGTDPAAKRVSTDALGAIVDFKRQLRATGIHLVFVPIPVKPFIYPEQVWPDYPAGAGPAWNRDRDAFKAKLAEAGVDVLDVTDALWTAKAQSGESLFLKLDTHWTPRGVAVAADRLAAHLKPHLPEPVQPLFTTRKQRVTNFGDLLRILEIQPSSGLFAPETVEIVQVFKGGRPAIGDDSSPVLLLGDSFTNIYHRKEMEWGEDAGLGEQLTLRLGVGVQVIAINGGGATAVRETLAQKPAALSHKKVIVWACSARDLYDEAIAWDHIPLGETK